MAKANGNALVLENEYNYSDDGGYVLDTDESFEEFIDRIYQGIIQNIRREMDTRNLTYRAMADISDLSYSYFNKLFSGNGKIGLCAFLKVAYALQMNPTDLMPFELCKRKTYGEKMDEAMNGLDVAAKNFCLDMVVNYSKDYRRRGHDNNYNR